MKASIGTSSPCCAVKSLSNKVGGMLCCGRRANKYKKLDTKLAWKIMEAKEKSTRNNFRSVNSIILRFPQFREGLKELRGVFEQYDEDSNGSIDHEELRKCLQKLSLQLTEREIDDLYNYCDMDGTEGIQFDEFILLMCLIYLLLGPSTSSHTLEMGSPQLKTTFDDIIEAFIFLDKNGDGKLNKNDMVKSMNDAPHLERSPSHITGNRFEEMDWDRNGQVSFREFLFALIKWVGIGSNEGNLEVEIEQAAV